MIKAAWSPQQVPAAMWDLLKAELRDENPLACTHP